MKKSLTLPVSFFTLVLSIFIHGQANAATSSDGEKFTETRHWQFNLLRSNTDQLNQLKIFKNCKATSRIYGTGKWSFSNGGYLVEFSKIRFGFPRQEVDWGIDYSDSNGWKEIKKCEM
ncbi:MAG: hypothetical protein WCI39_12635 [Gallionellaceae bacterium]